MLRPYYLDRVAPSLDGYDPMWRREDSNLRLESFPAQAFDPALPFSPNLARLVSVPAPARELPSL